MELTAAEIRRAVRAALAEDLGSGDVTTLATVPAAAQSAALMNAREPLTVAGLEFAALAFRELSPKVRIKQFVRDGFAAPNPPYEDCRKPNIRSALRWQIFSISALGRSSDSITSMVARM